jgi:hypothetical protein
VLIPVHRRSGSMHPYGTHSHAMLSEHQPSPRRFHCSISVLKSPAKLALPLVCLSARMVSPHQSWFILNL